MVSIDSVGTESLSYVPGTLRPLHRGLSLSWKWKLLDYAVENNSLPQQFLTRFCHVLEKHLPINNLSSSLRESKKTESLLKP